MFNGKTVRSIKNTDLNETIVHFTDGTSLSINTNCLEGEYETMYFVYDKNSDRWDEVNREIL